MMVLRGSMRGILGPEDFDSTVHLALARFSWP